MLNKLEKICLGLVYQSIFLFLVFMPVFANTPTQYQVVIIESQQNTVPTEVSAKLRARIESEILRSEKFKLVSAQKIKTLQNSYHENSGSTFYSRAVENYYAYQISSAHQNILKAIEQLGQNPGTQGQLFDAYLVKTQIDWEQGQLAAAKEAIRLAVKVAPHQTVLNGYQYSPKLKKFYEETYQEELAQHKRVDVVVSCPKNTAQCPIYVNGMLRGYGPKLTVSLFEGYDHVLSTEQTLVKWSSANKSKKILLEATRKQQQTQQDLQMSGQMELLSALQGQYLLNLKIIDLGHSKSLTATLQNKFNQQQKRTWSFVDENDDGVDVAQNVGKWFVAETIPTAIESQNQVPSAKAEESVDVKMTSGKKTGWLIGGAVAVAAGVVAALTMGGGGSSTVSTSVSGSVPGE